MTDNSPTQPGKSKALLITLIAIGGALLIAVIVLLVVLLTSGSGDAAETLPTPSSSEATPSPSPTPSVEGSTPTPEPSPSESEQAAPPPPPPPPPSNDPKINSFTASTTTFVCPEGPYDDVPLLHFEWTTTNVTTVYFGVDTNDASTASYATDPPGNEIDMFIGCPVGAQETHKYTLTVTGNGQKASKTIKVVVK